MIKKPLTPREREIASVAADLLLKGKPETRIAKYCIEKGMSQIQIRRFCEKLLQFGVCITPEVMDAHCLLTRVAHMDPDSCITFGKRLRGQLDKQNERV